MSHKSWHELLMLYLNGELSEEDRTAFEHYLAEDAGCRAELREWQMLANAMRDEAESRIDALPTLPASFYQKLHPIQRSPNGAYKTQEQKNMTSIAQPLHKPARSVSATLVAAVFAVIAFAGAALFTGNFNNPEPDMLSGIQAQMTETPTPAPTATFIPTSTPASTATSTPMDAQAEFIPSLVPTIIQPQGSDVMMPITAPIVSEPARLVENLDLQPGYGPIISLDVSPDGRHLVVSRAAPGVYSLWLIDRKTGEEKPVLVYSVELIDPQFNAEGTQVIVGTNGTGIFILDVSQFAE